MLPEPNFRVRPDEFVGRTREIDIFCQALQQGLVTGRTASFAILGDWGIGKSSLLLKLAALCSQPPFAMLPLFVSVSTDIPDYLRIGRGPSRPIRGCFAYGAKDASPPAPQASKLEIRAGRFRRRCLET